MPKIEPKDDSVRGLKGLHLYHAGWSNCSMRVRMTLEEKGLSWVSHHLNIRTGEHITPEYFAIHPIGLVPALVHDGDIWIDSKDIIRYLDDTYPEPRLAPVGETQIAQAAAWMDLASAIHVSAVKTYVYSTKPIEKLGKTAAELELYRKLQTNEELLAFHTRCSTGARLTEKDQHDAECLLHEAFAQLDTYLGEHRWLAGDELTLADITWVPLHYTLVQAGLHFDRHPNVESWARRIATRPSFQKAVVDWFDGSPPADG